MKNIIIIYDVLRTQKLTFKAHYRVYDLNRNLLSEDDYIYSVKKVRKMPPAVLKSKIVTGIYTRLKAHNIINDGDSYSSECLVSRDVLLQEMSDFVKPAQPSKVVKTFEKKVEVEDDPRIYSVQLINGHYTIVKVEKQYLTREQAKEELFNKQMGDL